MANILREVRDSFRSHDIIIKLIYINTLIFLVTRLMDIAAMSGSAQVGWFVWYVGMPMGWSLLTHPWTIVTNIFAHYEFFHFIFNMLCLYWFGRMFMQTWGSERRALIAYIAGGMGGCAVALLASLFLSGEHVLLGASGAIMSLLLATTVSDPDRRVWVTFFGEVKMKWVATAYVALSVLMLIGLSNVGGNLSHLGGALVGFLLAQKWKRHPEYSGGRFSTIFGNRRSKLKVTYNETGQSNTSRNPDWDYNKRRADENKELDRLLDKIKARGYESLTDEEKKRLFEISRNDEKR